jgi:flagellar M-ring protein FliF
MGALQSFWSRLRLGARVGLIAGLAIIGVTTLVVSYEVFRPEYQVLFTQLADADAASIVDQLKRLRIPYQLSDDGTTIEVPAAQVHETRLRLMSSGVPLSGVVGFEIFDKQGLGATEQSQRVSYQRALQGELARTVGSLEDVKQARVHLVLPESTLFKRDRQEARAAVSLTLKSGALSREQIRGIQRLVAASVAGLDAPNVVITDQRGVTLSGSDASALQAGGGAPEERLEIKRQVEDYITRKVAHLLDSTYGPGQAIVSVDASLNFDEIHRTVQDLLPLRGQTGERTGGVRHKRQVSAGAAADPNATADKEVPAANANSNSTMEVDYEYGRSVEQVIAAPGGITRLSIGVIVPGNLEPDKQKRITDLVRMAAGISEDRGDAIVVQPLDQLGAKPLAAKEGGTESVGEAHGSAPATVAGTSAATASHTVISKPQFGAVMTRGAVSGLLTGLALIVAAVILLVTRRKGALARIARTGEPLSLQERQQLLVEIRRALSSPAVAESRGRP